MTLGELSVKIKAKQGFLLTNEARGLAERFGFDLCAKVADRVINEGKNSKNAYFTPYSTRPIALSNYFGKSRNSSAEARVLAQKSPISYLRFRELNNLPVQFKNFSFTNYMWAHFGVLDIKQTKTSIEIVIGGTTPIAKQRIADNSKREKQSIIKPTQVEVSTISARIFKIQF